VLNKLRDAAFEDRSFYENALGILDERISDYKREINVLEAQVDAVEAAREREARLARLRETVEDLSDERDALLDQFESLEEETEVDVRNGSVAALREALERQTAVLEDIEEKERALEQRREEIASLENASVSYDEDVLVEREEIRFELEQVRADIIDAYLSGNASVDELRREENRLEASLENVTDELTR
jgi:chromosome segregation ATPase